MTESPNGFRAKRKRRMVVTRSRGRAGKTDLRAQMNKLGAEGWELVSVTTIPRGPAVVYTVAYLKRPK